MSKSHIGTALKILVGRTYHPVTKPDHVKVEILIAKTRQRKV